MHEKKNCIIYVICFELCRSLFSRRRRFLGLHRGVDQPNYMDVSNPDQAAGLVILIRPDTDVATANVQSLLKGQPFAQSSTNIPLYDFKEGGSYTFEIKKEDDKYVVLWNGKAMKTEFGAELDLSWRNGAFQNDKAYLALSMSDNQSKESKATITALFAAFAKRMRDDVGKKFQVVLFRKLADYEGVVSVKNGLTSDKTSTALIPWVTGVIGGTAVNKSATNMTYDGEYDVDTDFTQTQLEKAIKAGEFTFHRVGDQTRVLTDINTFVSITDEKSADFSFNQVMRVLDQIANDIASLFNSKYLGKVQNDASGRVSLWSDIVAHHTQLQTIRAIENFDSSSVTVSQGDMKKSVAVEDHVQPVSAMEQLYMKVIVE